jgi:hypothetical protein
MNFELQIRETNKIWIFKGIKPFGTNLNNSPKLFLGMIFKNMNLDDITSMQKFEDPYKWHLDLIWKWKEDLNLNMKFVLGFAL